MNAPNDPRLQNIQSSIVFAAVRLERARAEHEKFKSDPTKNVATGQAFYSEQQNFERIVRGFNEEQGSVLLEQLLEAQTERMRSIVGPFLKK